MAQKLAGSLRHPVREIVRVGIGYISVHISLLSGSQADYLSSTVFPELLQYIFTRVWRYLGRHNGWFVGRLLHNHTKPLAMGLTTWTRKCIFMALRHAREVWHLAM